MELAVIPWEQPTPPSEADLRLRFAQEGLTCYAWSNGPYDTYAPHDHPYHKVLYVLRGSITFYLLDLGTTCALKAGDRLNLPAGTLHAAEVGPEGVVCLEAHKPARGGV